MRVKTYTAETTVAAMSMVRGELGDEAIMVSTRTGSDGSTCVTAAIDPVLPANEDIEEREPLVFPDETEATIRQALAYHGVPPWLSSRLAKAAAAVEAQSPKSTAATCLGAALDEYFSFPPLEDDWPEGPLLLVGPPGSGKTITAAKLCARERVANRHVGVLTADTKRAGGVEQLAAFTRILDIELGTTPTPDDLGQALSADVLKGKRVIIDTPGCNPYDEKEMGDLLALCEAAGGSVVLTLPAGGDPMEAADMARAYADIGAKCMIVTRMDITRRYGGLLAAADGAGLNFADVSISAQVADGLIPLSPLALARLLMPHTEETNPAPQQNTAEASP
ncbi:MAG: hypothetical protein HN540_11080 [Rhodospirillaceae bacterium]|nr:hypothetical protein [Rhodospirillaceae bacterium]